MSSLDLSLESRTLKLDPRLPVSTPKIRKLVGDHMKELVQPVYGPNPIFGHAGDLGDVVYSLPAIRGLGGGVLHLFASKETRELMTPVRAASIIPLVERQKYIHKVEHGEMIPSVLNRFRQFLGQGCTLVDAHLKACKLPWTERSVRWLDVEPKAVTAVVVSRSARYQNPRFPWTRIFERYPEGVFLGHKDERFGPYRWYPTADLLEAASVIAGSELFIGNQSCLAAIAEGLKHPMILEVCPYHPDCTIHRVGRVNLVDEKLEL